MRPRAPRPRDPAARLLAARPFPSDNRKIHLPDEIPVGFQTGHRRFEAGRPSSVDAHRRQQHLDNGFVADGTSYYPRIRESSSSRETREQKIRTVANSVYELPDVSGRVEANTEPRYRKRSINDNPNNFAERKASRVPFLPSKKILDFDSETMAVLQSAFNGEVLSKEEFVRQALTLMKAQHLLHNERMQLTDELKSLFQEADVNASGELSWEILSFHIFRIPDQDTAEQETPTCSYKVDGTTAPVNLSFEVHGMFYFPDVNQVFLHGDSQSNFWMMDVKTSHVVKQASSGFPTGRIVDAMYWPTGKYVITSSASPVISFYDIDYLKLRQQIPCSGPQTSLTGHADQSIRRLYSSNTDGRVHVWDLDTLSCSHSFFAKSHSVSTELAVVDSMNQLAVACFDGKIYMIDLHMQQTAKTLHGHRQGIIILRYSSESGYLISGGTDQNIHVWNPHVESKIGSLLGHKHQLIGVEAIPHSSQIVSADESGIVKIWDLRKFSCLQSISREAYIKGGDMRTRTRSLKAMSYIASKKQIAISHSSVYFMNDAHTKATSDVIRRDAPVSSIASCRETRRRSQGDNIPKTVLEYHDKVGCDALKLPLAVIIIKHSQTIVAVTGYHVISWELTTSSIIQCLACELEDEITSATEIGDQYSCFVGTEQGTIARLTLPGAAVVAQKKIVESEIVDVKWVTGVRYLVCSSGEIGNVLVVQSDNLKVLFTLNHWRGTHTFVRQPQLSRELELSVPARLRNFFDPGEVNWLASLYLSATPDMKDNALDRSQAISILNSAIPSEKTVVPKMKVDISKCDDHDEKLSFPKFLDEAMRRMHRIQSGHAMSQAHFGIACLDVSSSSFQLVSGSCSDETFCVWNLRNGAVVTADSCAEQTNELSKDISFASNSHTTDFPEDRLPTYVAHTRFLQPFPFIVMITGGPRVRLSIWSCVSIPSLCYHPFQCILERLHGEYLGFIERVSMQEPSKCEEDSFVVTALEWVFDENCGAMLIVVGDDRGFITVYDFRPAHDELENFRITPEISTVEHRTRRLEASFLPVTRAWNTKEATPFRSLSLTALSAPGTNMIFVLVSATGLISFWNVDGECLGRLSDHVPPHSVSSIVAIEKPHWIVGNIARRHQYAEPVSSSEDSEKPTQRLALTHLRLDVHHNSLLSHAPIGEERAQRNAILKQLLHRR